MGVLARDGMRIGPLKPLNTGENGGAITRTEGDELTAFGHTCTAPSRGISVASNGTANVGSVARGCV